jgi:acetyl-CoA/propionyl-CoA carboxylase biotin carboxyl carrier protein
LFKKVLIANRGEIAVRVIRTCREMGIKTVAVYSESDKDALHVRLADEAYALGGNTPKESYLNTEAIINILKNCGAQALHPGYGFFSENADFAEAVSDAGVKFIGPPPEAIRIMGDKISSRIFAEKAGVNGVPGRSETISSADEIIEFGEQFGWPVAIKAAYGGGGRGMKVVQNADEAADAMTSAVREAESSFGRGEIYLEKYLSWPRHIEMQIFADSHSNVIWLGERDCSIQRRHQKLIEESPAADFSDEIRRKMGAAAVAIAKACNYENAGTVEFLYQDGEFYFLEMNTRLQVEHPVTEAVVGMDLVELQLRIAAGETLGIEQDAIERKGHAIELRLNAEDPANGGFLPSPGKITALRFPDGFGTRVDSGYETGDSISQYYDNLIAKMIAWAPDRDKAINKVIRMIDELVVEGVPTTAQAQKMILEHPDFREAKHSTRWLEERLDLSSIPPFSGVVQESEEIGSQVIDAEVNGKRYKIKLYIPEYDLKKPKTPVKKAHKSGGQMITGTGAITVPMQGTIVKVFVETGQSVEVGQKLCVLEAMKMENSITSDVAGIVKEIRVSAGEAVSAGDVVMVIS